MSHLKVLLTALFTVALLATSAVAFTQEKGASAVHVLTQTVIASADYPEPDKLPSGRIGMVVSSSSADGPNGPNGDAPCTCTGYLYNPQTNTSFWSTYTTPGCFPNDLLGCRDCCFRVLDDIGYDGNY